MEKDLAVVTGYIMFYDLLEDKTFNLGRLEQRLDFINRNFIQN